MNNILHISATSCALSTLMLAAASAAQTLPVDPSARNSSNALGEIVITAQKRETKLQDTPISISVLGEQEMENRHIVSLANLETGVPGLRITPFANRSSALQMAIRGIGSPQDANQPSRDQAVGVYVDGIYLGRAQGLAGALFDVERIEVLKGPQGTLFGRNTEGGAISIVTKKPSGELHFEATGGIGNFGSHELVAHLDLPSFKNISIKIDGLINKRGGTTRNPLSGFPDFNSFDKRGLHVAAMWRPSSNFSALYSFDTSRDASTPYDYHLLAKGRLPTAPLIVVQPERVDTAIIGAPLQESVGKAHGHALTLEWKTNENITLKSITAYRKLSQTQFDNNPFIALYTPNGAFGRDSRDDFRQNQFSQELQLLGDYAQFNFVGGAYYFVEHAREVASSPNLLRWNSTGTDYSLNPIPVGSAPALDRANKATNKSAAIFAQATWTPEALGSIVHLTAGGRLTRDWKKGSLFIVAGATPTVNGVTAPLSLDLSKSRFDPMVNIAVDVAPDVMLYGKWSTGYRSGGASSRSLIYRSYGPESVSTFEIGAKTEFFDRRVRFNLAAFATRYSDQQIDFGVLTPGVNRSTLETTNADGTGHIKGVEADLTLAVTDGLALSSSYAYLYTHLPKAPNPFMAGNPDVTVLPTYSPKHSASGALDYKLPLQAATLLAHLDINYASPEFTSPSDPLSRSQASLLVNGRLALSDIELDSGRARLTMAVWTRNMFNRSFVFFRSSIGALGQIGAFNEPRTYGLTATIRY